MSSHIPVIELFIKGSPTDKEEKGACPISEKWFMAFFSLVERGYVDLRITTVSPQNMPKSFIALGASRKLPVALVVDGLNLQSNEDMTGHVADTDDEIEALLNRFHCPEMSVTVSESYTVFQDLYSYFNRYLRDNNPTPLVQCLKKLDSYLTSNGTKFLDGDELHFNDCILMPKLQHIRVACKSFKDFDIPFEYRGLWAYIKTMYETPAFRQSCPADCDIQSQYIEKVQPPPEHVTNKRISLSTRHSTTYLPEEIAAVLGQVENIGFDNEIYDNTNQNRQSYSSDMRSDHDYRNSTLEDSVLDSVIPAYRSSLRNNQYDSQDYEGNVYKIVHDSQSANAMLEPKYSQSEDPENYSSLYTYSYHDYSEKPRIASIGKTGNDSDID